MPKGKRLLIVLSDAELKLLRAAAAAEALPLATFIRAAAVRAAKKRRK